jgi:predicted  nucleic acid-binding Zn-ribbon protein
MFDKLLEFGKQLLSIKSQVEKNTTDIKELGQQIKDLTSAVVKLSESNQLLRLSMEHLKETEEDKRNRLSKDFQQLQENYKRDQENMFLKLQVLMQQEQISRLSQGEAPRSLPAGDEPAK